jgi:hypothetical protein
MEHQRRSHPKETGKTNATGNNDKFGRTMKTALSCETEKIATASGRNSQKSKKFKSHANDQTILLKRLAGWLSKFSFISASLSYLSAL